MTAATLVHGRSARLWPVAFAAALAVALGAAALAAGSRTGAPLSASTPSSPADAIAAWLGDEPYAGDCATATDGTCSALVEDRGDTQIHLVGPYATDAGTDLLLERTSTGWAVVAAAPWPPVGTEAHFGPPWSPQTAIAAWWSEQGVVHLRSCAEAAEVAAQAAGQTFACSTDAGDGTWRSSVVGSEDEVVLRLTEQPDRTFVATPA